MKILTGEMPLKFADERFAELESFCQEKAARRRLHAIGPSLQPEPFLPLQLLHLAKKLLCSPVENTRNEIFEILKSVGLGGG